MSLCLASAGVVKSLSIAAFMLAWTHSVEKIEWQEDWRVTPLGLEIVEARVKGSGAGMEPPPEARLVDGWFRWQPQRPVLPELVLGNSGVAGEWRLCTDGTCRTLSDVMGQPTGTNATTLRVCEAPESASNANQLVQTEHVAMLIATARARRVAGDSTGALAIASEAIRLDPQNADAFEARAETSFGIRNYEHALDDYDAAIRLKPKDAHLYKRRAGVFGMMHQFRLAVRDYTEAIKLDLNVSNLMERASAFKKVRRYDLALDDQTAAIRLEPASADLYNSRGQTYAYNNAYDRAIADYTEALRLQPTANTYLNRGVAYQLKGDLDPAIADYDKAIALDGKLALAYNNRGMALRDKGNRARALADFTTAIQLDPDLTIAAEHRKALAQEMALPVAVPSVTPPVAKPARTACTSIRECIR